MWFGIGLIIVAGLLTALSRWRRERPNPQWRDDPARRENIIGPAIMLGLALKDFRKANGSEKRS